MLHSSVITGKCTASPFKIVMGLFDSLYPDEYLESAYDVDYEGWYKKGKRAVIFDIDNTLVRHGAPADDRSKALFERLSKIGYRCMVLSNNTKTRVKSFAEEAHADLKYIHMANKPFKSGYLKALDMLGVSASEALFVGDQIFTDVIGARNTGIYSILIEPINKKESFQVVLKRNLENVVLKFYKKQKDDSR